MSIVLRKGYFAQIMLKTIKAFTLAELLIVVLVIGILAAIAIPLIIDSVEKARGSHAKSGLVQIYRAELDYSGPRGGAFTNSIDDLTDVALNERHWTFSVVTPTPTTFTAIATRTAGRQSGQTITVDQTATMSGNWDFL